MIQAVWTLRWKDIGINWCKPTFESVQNNEILYRRCWTNLVWLLDPFQMGSDLQT